MTWLLFLAGTVCGGMLGMVVMALCCVSGRESERRAALREQTRDRKRAAYIRALRAIYEETGEVPHDSL